MENPGPFFQKFLLSIRIATAYISLAAEILVAAFGPLLLWTGLFFCLWLFDISFTLLTIIFWLGAFGLFFKAVWEIRIPHRTEALHRLEKESGLQHRPLQSLEDRKIGEGSDEFWTFEKERQKKLLSMLRFAKPSFEFAKRDPYSLRIALVLLLICGFLVAHDMAWQRIHTGLFSFARSSPTAPLPFAQLRITPPGYTGRQVMILNEAAKEPIDIVQGSRISVEVRKGQEIFGRAPVLKIGDFEMSFAEKENIWEVEALIPPAGSIRIGSFGFSKFRQEINHIADTPPSIEWKAPPVTLPNGDIRLPLKISDDFGIKKIILRGILPPGAASPRFGRDIYEEKNLSVPIRNGKAEIAPIFDLTGHPWAGSSVSLMVEIHDFADNVAYTAPIDFILPSRRFRNPLARQIADSRARLLQGGAPRQEIMPIGEILLNPQLYAWDNITTLALRSVIGRLLYNESDSNTESASATLWQIAMRLETGGAGETHKNLAEAIENLQQALQNGDKEQAAQLMQQVLQALAGHLNALGRQMQQSATPQVSAEIDLKSLGDFLKELEEEIRKGNMGSAMDKLSQLQQLSETMQAASQGLPQDIQKSLQALEDLQSIIKHQQDLLDKTRTGKKANAGEQKSILNDTSSLKNKIPNAPEKLGEAEKEMTNSASSLEKRDPASSIPHQEAALRNLRETGKTMRDELQKRLQNILSLSGNPAQNDPLGRRQGGLEDDGIEIPEPGGQKKAEEVIKILRERAGDMARDKEERDYYQRLLKQW